MLSPVNIVFPTHKLFLEVCPNLVVWLTSEKVQTFTDSHFRHNHVWPRSRSQSVPFKSFESCAKAEVDLNKTQRDVTEAINNAERRVRVEQLVTHCEEAMTKAFAKNEQLLELAKETSDPASVNADLEKWLKLIKTMKFSGVEGSIQTSALTLNGHHNLQKR